MTTTTKRPKAEPQPATFAEIAARKMRETIEQYRQHVARAAAGEQLNADDLDRVLEVLAYMRLPEYAWDRDVQAHREHAATATALADATAKGATDDARLANVVARIKVVEEELRSLRAEQRMLAEIKPMTRVSYGRRLNELAVEHPHLFLDVAEAAQMRQQAKDKSAGVRPTSSPEPMTTVRIGE